MGEKYVQEEFLGEESLGEKSVQEEFLGEESLGEKYMGEKYVQEKKLGEESLCEKYMGQKSVQEEFLGEKSLGEKYMGEMYWRVSGWKVWWKIGVDGMLAFVAPFSGFIICIWRIWLFEILKVLLIHSWSGHCFPGVLQGTWAQQSFSGVWHLIDVPSVVCPGRQGRRSPWPDPDQARQHEQV